MTEHTKAQEHSLVAAVLFLLAWMGAVVWTGGNLSSGALIGILVACLFGIGYYLFMYLLPQRSKRP
ncbi:MAG: hypothetical protein MUC48_21765 [Leptolyngbya sp. Prado105]|jgi:hypothetical protein|nr:hypothetical protein [Leptolyngbya sp. Prado105]